MVTETDTNRPRRLPEVVADRIEKFILDGKIQPGEKLPTEPMLSDMYDVSRQVVREAARLLEHRGIVSIRAGRGMVAAEVTTEGIANIYQLFLRFNPENFSELLEVRRVLEPGIAAVAATQRTDEDIASLQKLLSSARLQSSDYELCLALDLEFHNHVSGAAHNRFLSALADPVNIALRESYADPIAYLASLENTFVEHQAILDAIIAKNPEAASLATLAHLTRIQHEGSQLVPVSKNATADDGQRRL